MDRPQLADFLRTRRETLQPEDVGLARGQRRRTGGLRREEVSSLAGMSSDYYSRIEQQRGPQPSEQILASLARALRLNVDERDHLFRLAGHNAPVRVQRSDHISPGIMRVLDRLADTPAQVMSAVGETLFQTGPAVTLMGNQTDYTGLNRAAVYRWFMDATSRWMYPEEDHPLHTRYFTANLRAAYSRLGKNSQAGTIVDALLAESPEFATVWADHEIGTLEGYVKRFVHPEVGPMTLQCQQLQDPVQGQALLVFTATPGTESHDRLALLSVLGNQELNA